MDFRDQDSNGEGLYGARNENSVLFSLDSLTSLDKDSGAGSANGGFGTSGEASGLIDINTLSRMSNSGSADSDDENNPPPMESVVFNQVVAKRSKQRIIIAVAAVLAIIGIIVGVAAYYVSDYKAKKQDAEIAAQEEADRAKKEAEERQAEIDKLKKDIAQAQADAKQRDVDQEKVQAELAKRQAKLDELMAKDGGDAGDSKAAGSKKSGSSAKGGSGSSDAAPAAAAPAPAKNKAPNKEELIAALKAANTKAAKCGKGGSLGVTFNLSGNAAKGVKATGGTFAGSATERCILTIVEKNRWPDGTASGIKYTFKL